MHALIYTNQHKITVFNLTRSQPPQTWSTPHEYGICLIFFSSVKIEDLEHLKYRFSVGTCKHVRKSCQQEYTCQRLRPIPAHILVKLYVSVWMYLFTCSHYCFVVYAFPRVLVLRHLESYLPSLNKFFHTEWSRTNLTITHFSNIQHTLVYLFLLWLILVFE